LILLPGLHGIHPYMIRIRNPKVFAFVGKVLGESDQADRTEEKQ